MSSEAVIGALRVVLDADNDNFESAMDSARAKVGQLETSLSDMSDKLKTMGTHIAEVAAGIAAAFTAAMTAVAVTSNVAAADVQTAMNRLSTALGNVSAEQLKALETQARSMGESVGKGASDAIAGMEGLAKAGVSAGDILGGAFAASLKLAAIGQTDLGPATATTAAIMRDFSIDASQLGPVVDKVTGALMAGHGGLDAYKTAVSTAGETAVGAGIHFRDFNTVVASLGSVLRKGEDAGASFNEFLHKLGDRTDKSKQEMKDLGASFYDASGKVKPMADVADELRKKFAGLSEQTRSKVFTEMFGTSGLETAIALMRLGKQGFLDLQSTIDKASGDAQAAKSQEGYAAAVARLSAAFQDLKITIGEAGLVDLFTNIANAMSKFVRLLEGFAPIFYQIGAAFSALAAATGPLLAIIGGTLYFAFGIFLRTLGPIGWAISAIIEPIGTLVAAMIRLGLAAISLEGLAAFGEALTALLGPVGLVTAGIGLVIYAMYQHQAVAAESAAAQEQFRTSMDGAKPALDKAAAAISDMAGKTGEAAKAARDHADALLADARAAVINAAHMAEARAAVANLAAAESERYAQNANQTTFGASGAAAAGVVQVGAQAMRDQAGRMRAEAKAAADGARAARQSLAELEHAINAPPPKAIKYTPPSDKKEKSERDPKDKHGLTPADLEIQKQIEAATLRGDAAVAQKLQDQLDLNKQIEAYQRAGLGLADATVRAHRDMTEIQDARVISENKAITAQELSASIDIAKLDQNYKLEDSLQRQANLQKLIDFYKSQDKTDAEARVLATKAQADQDAAAARVRQRWVQNDADAQMLRMAQLRGDSDEEIRQIQRVIDVKKRSLDLQQNDLLLDPAAATAQANSEADAQHKAELTSKFRDIFQGGFKAALDGNVGSWFQTWWKDRVQKGMEEALNNLADTIAKLFSKIGSGDSSSGGIGGFLAGLFGHKSTSGSGDGSVVDTGSAAWSGFADTDVPAFATGGGFTVGGKSGIDQNMVSMRLSKGEMVDIRKPGNDNGPGGGDHFETHLHVDGGVDLATRTETYRLAGAVHDSVMQKVADRDRRRG